MKLMLKLKETQINNMTIKVITKCPYCKSERSVWLPVKNIKCFKCGKTYKLVYKRPIVSGKIHTIIKLEKGDINQLRKYIAKLKYE